MTAYQSNRQRRKDELASNKREYFDPALANIAGLGKMLQDIDETMYDRGRDEKRDERQKVLDEETAVDKQYKRLIEGFDREDKRQALAKKESETRADQQALADKRKAEEEKIRAEEERKAKKEREGEAVLEAVGARAPGEVQQGAVMRPGGWRPGEEMADIEKRAKAAGMSPDRFKAELDAIENETRGKAREAARKDTVAEAGIDADESLAEQRRRKPAGPKPKTPEEIERQRKKDALLDAQLDLAKSKATDQGKQLGADVIKGLGHTKSALAGIPKLRALKDKIKTGQVENAAQQAGKAVTDMPDYQEFISRAFILKKLAARAIEGGRLTDSDMVLYDKYLANPSMDDQEFSRIVDVLEDTLRESLAEESAGLAEGGYNVPPRYRPDAPTGGDPSYDDF